jgi:CRP/FNR family cyclic AMP-dependent transcriptional regulator
MVSSATAWSAAVSSARELSSGQPERPADGDVDEPDVPFLRWLNDEEGADLRPLSQRRAFSRGDVIFNEGDPGEEVIVLRAGRAKVCARRGGREVILSVLDPGSLVGEISAIDGSRRSATVIALEPVEIDVIGLEEFSCFLLSHPRVPLELLRLLASRLRSLSTRQLEFGAASTLTRVCGTITRLAERYGTEVEGRIEIDAPLSQQEMASWSGMSREAFVKGLHQLRSLGWMAVEDHRIVLLDPGAISQRARLG